MKAPATLLFLLSMPAWGPSAAAQAVRLTFDSDQTDYGAYATSLGETQLLLSRSGGSVAANDFTELNGLSSESYSLSGAALAPHTAVGFSITATGGSDSHPATRPARSDGTGLDVGGGGIDSGEAIRFIFDTRIEISEFDFAEIDNDEFAAVTIAGATHSFGSNDGDRHSGQFTLQAGQALEFNFAAIAAADYDLQGFSFNIVPEPRSYAALAGCAALAYTALRRRRHRARPPTRKPAPAKREG